MSESQKRKEHGFWKIVKATPAPQYIGEPNDTVSIFIDIGAARQGSPSSDLRARLEAVCRMLETTLEELLSYHIEWKPATETVLSRPKGGKLSLLEFWPSSKLACPFGFVNTSPTGIMPGRKLQFVRGLATC